VTPQNAVAKGEAPLESPLKRGKRDWGRDGDNL